MLQAGIRRICERSNQLEINILVTEITARLMLRRTTHAQYQPCWLISVSNMRVKTMGLKLYGIALNRHKITTQRSSNAQTSRAFLTKRQLHNLLPIPYDKIWQGLRFYDCHMTRTRALYPGLGLYGSKNNNNNKNIDLTLPIIFFF